MGGLNNGGRSSPYDKKFNLAFEGALEVYSLNYCNQYPANGKLTFLDVALYDYNYNLISNPAWSWEQNSLVVPQCWYGGQVSPTQLTLYYGLVTSPAALNFGQHYTDQPPVYLTTTLTNHSTSQPATIVSIGQNLPGYFLVSGTSCGSTLGAGASCSITVEFDVADAPKGTDRATMAIVYQSNTTPPQPAQLNVPLVGTAVCRYNCFGPVGN